MFPLKITLSREKLEKYIYIEVLVLCSVIFLACAGLLADYYINSAKQKSQYDELSKLVQQHLPSSNINDTNKESNAPGSSNPAESVDPSENTGSSENSGGTGNTVQVPTSKYTTVINPVTQQEIAILTEYAPIYKLNHHLVGWIQIAGTRVNYPVLQTPDWANYYLTRDFNGENSRHGAIYVNESANIQTPSDNVTIYGHKMRDGSMFASLHEYKKEDFFKAHPYISFDTIYDHYKYQILAVFMTTAGLETDFAYHTFVNGDMESFSEYVAKCKELSLYDTGVSASYGDKLITLSTCEHTIDSGRFVVVAKRID